MRIITKLKHQAAKKAFVQKEIVVKEQTNSAITYGKPQDVNYAQFGFSVVHNTMLDSHGNKVHLNIYSTSEAITMLNSLSGCSGCIDCKNCVGCYDCVSCSNLAYEDDKINKVG